MSTQSHSKLLDTPILVEHNFFETKQQGGIEMYSFSAGRA